MTRRVLAERPVGSSTPASPKLIKPPWRSATGSRARHGGAHLATRDSGHLRGSGKDIQSETASAGGGKSSLSIIFCSSLIPRRQAQAAGSRGRGIARRHGSSASAVLRLKSPRAMFPAHSRVCIDPASAVRDKVRHNVAERLVGDRTGEIEAVNVGILDPFLEQIGSGLTGHPQAEWPQTPDADPFRQLAHSPDFAGVGAGKRFDR